MKSCLVLIVALILVAAVAYAATGVANQFETITPGNTPTAFTAAKVTPTSGPYAGQAATAALITAITNTINICYDGTTPTQSLGTDACHPLEAGDSFYIRGSRNVKNFKCIDRVSGSAGKIKATFIFGGE